MSSSARGRDGAGEGTPSPGSEPGSEPSSEHESEPEPERVNLFTVSAMRLHLPRGGLPPTPGTEPSMVQRFARRVRQAGQLLEAVRERLRGR